MKVTFKTKKIEKLNDEKYLYSLYPKGVVSNIISFLEQAVVAPNLFFMQTTWRGRNIEKLKGKLDTYSARLNKDYRIEFEVEEELIIKIVSIKVSKIHKHKY